MFGVECKPEETTFHSSSPFDPIKPNGDPFVFAFHATCKLGSTQKMVLKKGDSLFDDGLPSKSKYRLELEVLPHVNVKLAAISQTVFERKYGPDLKQTQKYGDHVRFN